MPVQTPQWMDVLCCCICCNSFNGMKRQPISLVCCHTACRECLLKLKTKQCPFDQNTINITVADMPQNTRILKILGLDPPPEDFDKIDRLFEPQDAPLYKEAVGVLESLCVYLKRAPSDKGGIIWSPQLSRPIQRKLINLICCNLVEPEGRLRAAKAARSTGERCAAELLMLHQNPQHISSNLWATVRARGCQFLGPAMQEEVLNLVLHTLSGGEPISRKTLVLYIVQMLEKDYPQASKTSIGHVVQLLYRASCFHVIKRESESSLMQLKEEFRSYETLRREHDAQIVQIAMEAGLRISPDQWSALLYGDQAHKSYMQSIIDRLQSPQSFCQSIQELLICVQRTGDPGNLCELRSSFDTLAEVDVFQGEISACNWTYLLKILRCVEVVVAGLVKFCQTYSHNRTGRTYDSHSGSAIDIDQQNCQQSHTAVVAYKFKTSMCRDVGEGKLCVRGDSCTFAHSFQEMERYRARSRRMGGYKSTFMIPTTVKTTTDQLPVVGRLLSADPQQLQCHGSIAKVEMQKARRLSGPPLPSTVTSIRNVQMRNAVATRWASQLMPIDLSIPPPPSKAPFLIPPTPIVNGICPAPLLPGTVTATIDSILPPSAVVQSSINAAAAAAANSVNSGLIAPPPTVSLITPTPTTAAGHTVLQSLNVTATVQAAAVAAMGLSSPVVNVAPGAASSVIQPAQLAAAVVNSQTSSVTNVTVATTSPAYQTPALYWLATAGINPNTGEVMPLAQPFVQFPQPGIAFGELYSHNIDSFYDYSSGGVYELLTPPPITSSNRSSVMITSSEIDECIPTPSFGFQSRKEFNKALDSDHRKFCSDSSEQVASFENEASNNDEKLKALTRKREEILSRLSAVQSLKISESYETDHDYLTDAALQSDNNASNKKVHELMVHRIATSVFLDDTPDLSDHCSSAKTCDDRSTSEMKSQSGSLSWHGAEISAPTFAMASMYHGSHDQGTSIAIAKTTTSCLDRRMSNTSPIDSTFYSHSVLPSSVDRITARMLKKTESTRRSVSSEDGTECKKASIVNTNIDNGNAMWHHGNAFSPTTNISASTASPSVFSPWSSGSDGEGSSRRSNEPTSIEGVASASESHTIPNSTLWRHTYSFVDLSTATAHNDSMDLRRTRSAKPVSSYQNSKDDSNWRSDDDQFVPFSGATVSLYGPIARSRVAVAMAHNAHTVSSDTADGMYVTEMFTQPLSTPVLQAINTDNASVVNLNCLNPAPVIINSSIPVVFKSPSSTAAVTSAQKFDEFVDLTGRLENTTSCTTSSVERVHHQMDLQVLQNDISISDKEEEEKRLLKELERVDLNIEKLQE